jgi:serine protease Do
MADPQREAPSATVRLASFLAAIAALAAAFVAWRFDLTALVQATPPAAVTAPGGPVSPPAAALQPAPVLAPGKLAAAPSDLSILSDVAERAVQSVVNISTTRVTRRAVSEEELYFRRYLGMRNPGEHDGEVRENSLGSGVIVSDDGVILTNNHVIDRATTIRVKLADGREFQAKLVGADPRSDLAVLRLNLPPDQLAAAKLQPLPLANSDLARLGEAVLAIGSPFGLAQSVSLGIVSAKGRADVNIADYEDFIQTDAAINPGNSGGALVNLRGELLGINTAIASSSGGSVGIGFAIPTNMVRPIMDSLLKEGRVIRGWLGVGIQELDGELRKAFAAGTSAGVLVTDVAAGSPAATSGLQRGDVITKIGDHVIDAPVRLRTAIATAGAQADIVIDFLRDGKVLQTRAKLAEQPDPRRQAQQALTPDQMLGMQVAPLDERNRQQFQLPAGLRGAVVEHVEEGSPAAAAGLQPGDVVLEVSRRPVASPADLQRALAQPSPLFVLLLYRDGRAFYATLQR